MHMRKLTTAAERNPLKEEGGNHPWSSRRTRNILCSHRLQWENLVSSVYQTETSEGCCFSNGAKLATDSELVWLPPNST